MSKKASGDIVAFRDSDGEAAASDWYDDLRERRMRFALKALLEDKEPETMTLREVQDEIEALEALLEAMSPLEANLNWWVNAGGSSRIRMSRSPSIGCL